MAIENKEKSFDIKLAEWIVAIPMWLSLLIIVGGGLWFIFGPPIMVFLTGVDNPIAGEEMAGRLPFFEPIIRVGFVGMFLVIHLLTPRSIKNSKFATIWADTIMLTCSLGFLYILHCSDLVTMAQGWTNFIFGLK